MTPILSQCPLLVVGAGIMGSGIAQVAAQAGHPVLLFDMRDGAAAEARARLAATLDGLAAKGKLTAEAAQAAMSRIRPIGTLAEARDARLVVEAIVERIEAKRELFRQLEELVAADAVFASNTSSISITAMANGLKHPGRLVGMHFFNPVPVMKLVEVISGLSTEPVVAEAVFQLSLAWGKAPVHARSTPGFIVNRIARPYYAEALALLQERAAEPQVLDACFRAAGFRMGPCELMDLIGHDTNFAVTSSVYEANFYDKRYMPSLVQRELVDGGLLGRKSGRGFYTYPAGVPALPAPPCERPAPALRVTVHGQDAIGDMLEEAAGSALAPMGQIPARQRDDGWTGLDIDGARLVLTEGAPAFEVAAVMGVADLAVFDRPAALSGSADRSLAYAVNAGAGAGWRAQAPAWLRLLGFLPLPVADTPGLVVARTLAMLINEAADAVLQGVCTPEAADAAMRLGVNYPAGPFEWLQAWSGPGVARVVDALDSAYRGERYRLSPWLRRADHRASVP